MIHNSGIWRILRFTLLAVLVLSGIIFPIEFRKQYESSTVAPSQRYFEELMRIRDLFGYGNQSDVIFVRYDLSSSTRLAEWTLAITGVPIYVGTSPLYYLANRTETSLLKDSVYVGQTNNLVIHHLFGRPLILSDLLSAPTTLELINSTIIVPGLFVSKLARTEALALFSLNDAIVNGNPLPPTPGVSIGRMNTMSWQIYLAKGGFNNATLTQSNGSFSISLTAGEYFVRLYDIFSPALNLTSEDIIAIHLWSAVNKQLLVGLSSQDNPLLPGGTTADYAFYSSQLHPGWQYELIGFRDNSSFTGNFAPSSIVQMILYLERDQVIDQIISDGVYLLEPA